ncbi:hypothetical protein [Janibacter hoylei]|uniref:hypothetical protein n=1 Tax=Janibacter hoylei TaxID=364298 RepID=UPI002492F079|nr:hypothetical protein [Janibacter hoylei]
MAGHSVIVKPISARIPMSLYEQAAPIVKAMNGPSWGQLVAWACELHMAEVLARIEQAATVDPRAPRGHNRIAAGGQLISARVTDVELAAIQRTREHAIHDLGIDPTNTALVIAGLTVGARVVGSDR